MGPLIQFLILIIVAGALLYILSIAPIDGTLKQIAKKENNDACFYRRRREIAGVH